MPAYCSARFLTVRMAVDVPTIPESSYRAMKRRGRSSERRSRSTRRSVLESWQVSTAPDRTPPSRTGMRLTTRLRDPSFWKVRSSGAPVSSTRDRLSPRDRGEALAEARAGDAEQPLEARVHDRDPLARVDRDDRLVDVTITLASCSRRRRSARATCAISIARSNVSQTHSNEYRRTDLRPSRSATSQAGPGPTITSKPRAASSATAALASSGDVGALLDLDAAQ